MEKDSTGADGHTGSTTGFWTEDVEELVASRPNSRWAIVDWRHFLAPASIVTVPRGELHFSRDIMGRPVIVPTTGCPYELIDDSMGELHAGSGPDTGSGTEPNGEGRNARSSSDDNGGDSGRPLAVPPPPLSKADRSFDVQNLQFLLIKIGFLRPSAIRFHTGIYGRHTMAAVGALQAVCGLNPTGQYDSETAVALTRMVCERTEPPSIDDRGKLLGDVVGTAIYPSDLYQRMSDAAKTPEEVARTNGSVLEIQGTDIDGAGGEQRYRIWKEQKASSKAIQDELQRKASGAHIFAVAQKEYAGACEDETVTAQGDAHQPTKKVGTASSDALDDPTGAGRDMSASAVTTSEAAREVRAHRISASRTRRMVRDSEGLWDSGKNFDLNHSELATQSSGARPGNGNDNRPTSPRLGGGWREQIGAASAGKDRLTVVQGSLALLIPHEPVISGSELVARVNAMAGIVVAEETQQLHRARESMQRFASTCHPSARSTPNQHGPGEPEPEHECQQSVEGGGCTIERVSYSQHGEAILWLPAELTELERSVLHGEAEQLGLGHVSIGEAAGRRLLLWKHHQFVATSMSGALAAAGRRTDEFAEPVRRFDALPTSEQQQQPTNGHAKTPKLAENKVGPDHEALRVPVVNARGREIVGNPAALIEVVKGRNGELVEGSRGFVLPKAWRVAAMALTSRAEPLVNQHRSRVHKSTGILSSFESVSSDYWSVCQNSTDSGNRKESCNKKVWASIELPSECSGEQLLYRLGLWMTACGINDHSDSSLYGPMARRLICQAFDRVDDAKGLLVDMLAWIQAAEQDGQETVDRYVAMGHFVLGALTGKKILSKRAEAELQRQQAGDPVPTPVRYVRRPVDGTPSAHESTHVSTAGSARSQLLRLVGEALRRSLDSENRASAGGMARLQLKGLLGLNAVRGPDESQSALTDTAIIAEQHATQAATEAALSCVDVVLKAFQKDEEEQKHMESNRQGSARVMGSIFAMAIELLVELQHRWNEATAIELLHWLVASGELTAAACLVETNVDSLAVSMIEEILATGAGAAKKAAKYVKQFGLSEQFAGIQTKPKKGKKHGGANGNGNGNSNGPTAQPALAATAELPMFRLPASVVVHDVSTLEQLDACTAALRGASDESGESGTILCALDAEWEPFGSAETPTKVSLLQLATAEHGVFLIDMLALAATDSDELQAFWHVLSNEVVVVGFGVLGDLTRISQSYPQLSRCLYQTVELQKVINALVASNVVHETVGRGLGGASQVLLAADISKAEQTSHWGSRPLSASQRQYAAIDAYVLLPLLVAALRALVGVGTKTAVDDLMSAHTTTLPESLAQVSQSVLKWVRPVAASVADAPPPRSHLPPLGKAGVSEALRNLGLLDLCPVFRSDAEDGAQGQPGIMCKTIALLAHETEVLLCVLRLSQRLHISRCASAFGLRRTDVRMAREDELTDMVGYPRGSIGPVGARHGAKGVLVDKELATEERLLCGAGEEGWVFAISAALMVETIPDCQVVSLR